MKIKRVIILFMCHPLGHKIIKWHHRRCFFCTGIERSAFIWSCTNPCKRCTLRNRDEECTECPFGLEMWQLRLTQSASSHDSCSFTSSCEWQTLCATIVLLPARGLMSSYCSSFMTCTVCLSNFRGQSVCNRLYRVWNGRPINRSPVVFHSLERELC